METYLNEWHSQPEAWDNALDTQIHRWYADATAVFPKRPYFSPSATKACPRELYFKQKRAKKDGFLNPPYQGRWTRLGTMIGDMIQRDILFMEKHYEDKVGDPCPFKFERTDRGEPMFEDFAKKNTKVTHKGRTFYLYGTCDGIMEYTTRDGEVIRVGLEIKSKQTTAAKTSLYSMKGPEEKHVKQCVAYAEMYQVDYYVILYVNASKKAWVYADGEFEKNPDIRAFGVYITQDDKDAIYDRFVDILDAVEKDVPPPLDIDNWTFNGFKTECAKSLTEEEYEELRKQVAQVKKSGLPPFVKRNYSEALAFIDDVREREAME